MDSSSKVGVVFLINLRLLLFARKFSIVETTGSGGGGIYVSLACVECLESKLPSAFDAQVVVVVDICGVSGSTISGGKLGCSVYSDESVTLAAVCNSIVSLPIDVLACVRSHCRWIVSN